VRQEHFSAAPLALAFDAGANVAARMMAVQHAFEDWQVWIHGLALQLPFLKTQKLPRRLICQLHQPRLVQRQNGQGAGLNQDAQPLFRLSPEAHLFFALAQMSGQQTPALVELHDEETGHGKSGDDHQQPPGGSRDPISGVPGYRLRHDSGWSGPL